MRILFFLFFLLAGEIELLRGRLSLAFSHDGGRLDVARSMVVNNMIQNQE
jgi:hypothetical protein